MTGEIPPLSFSLMPHERHDPLWVTIKARLEERLRHLRARNDSALTETQTATLRGHIQAMKWIIALGDEPPTEDG